MLYGHGIASYTFADLSEEAFAEMQSDELVEMIGRTAICGKFGNEYQQYTYGAYMDSYAEKFEYLKLAAERFPPLREKWLYMIISLRICFLLPNRQLA